MRVMGTRKHQWIVGVMILAFASFSQAKAAEKTVEKKVEKKVVVETLGKNIESTVSAPVIEEGSRLFVGDLSKDEFFILSKDEPDPIKKGPVFVNVAPLQAGIDPHHMLGNNQDAASEDEDPIREAVKESNEQPTQVASEGKSYFNESVAVVADKSYFNAGLPVDVRFEDASPVASRLEQNKNSQSNFSKVKHLLHTMTRKIAVKKSHANDHLAFKSKAVSKSHLAMMERQRKVLGGHHLAMLKKAWRPVEEKHGRKPVKQEQGQELAVMKIKFIS